MPGRLGDKTAVVTGASEQEGIGGSTAIAFAREGANVAVVARRPEEGRAVAKAATDAGKANGGDARFVRADVTDPDDVAAMIDTVRGWWGEQLHVLFNNVGAAVGGGRFPRERLENFEATLRLSLTSVWLVTRACWNSLAASGNASVITNSSGAAVLAVPPSRADDAAGYFPNSAYGAAKAGVEALTRYIAQEGAPVGVRANCIRPGQILTPLVRREDGKHMFHELLTPMQLLERAGTSGDIASSALFLASDESAFVTGQVLSVDGGFVNKL